jgi:hypothetical protein
MVEVKLANDKCLIGAHCSHAILTDKIGVYRCPFGSCFKRRNVIK